MKENDTEFLTMELCRGVEGDCLYLNDFRIAGPKPWGGGQIIKKWKVRESDIRRALKEKNYQTENSNTHE